MARKLKWLRGLLAGIGIAAVTATFAAGASAHGVKTITIRHQMRGCHTWALTGGPAKASLRITVHRDELIQVIDNDVMPHRLIQVSGPKVPLQTPNMHTMGARAQFVLVGKGIYKFKTRAGEDYPSMGEMHTVGPDNVLRLTIVAR
jgi:hypothetical protein